MRTRWPRRWIVLLWVPALACGGSGSTPTSVIHVAGSYDIHKTVVEDTCGTALQGQTFTNPASINHTPGATRFVINDHGTRDLPGTLQADGGFTLDGASAIVHGSIPAVDHWDNGRFTASGFQVRDTTDLEATATSAACRLVAQWEGVKGGVPNVIP